MPELTLTDFSNFYTDELGVSLEDTGRIFDKLLSWLPTIVEFPEVLRVNPYYYGHIGKNTKTIHKETRYVYKRILKSDFPTYSHKSIASPEGLITLMSALFSGMEHVAEIIEQIPGIVETFDSELRFMKARKDRFSPNNIKAIEKECREIVESVKAFGEGNFRGSVQDSKTIAELYGNKIGIYDTITVNNRLEKRDPIVTARKIRDSLTELARLVDLTVEKLDKNRDKDNLILTREAVESFVHVGESVSFYVGVVLEATTTLTITNSVLYDIV